MRSSKSGDRTLTDETLIHFMCSKLRFRRMDRSRHAEFVLELKNGVIPFPVTVRISRHSGNLSTAAIRATAKDMGLSVQGLEIGVSCNLCRECVIICHLTAIVDSVVRRQSDVQRDPIVFGDIGEQILRICESVALVLDDLSNAENNSGVRPIKWRPQESKELKRARDVLKSDRWYPLASALADRLLAWIDNGYEPA
jgi:hypothetical protein